MKSYTDIEQSKKLAEILPLESADMSWVSNGLGKPFARTIPIKGDPEELCACWSLATLLHLLPNKISSGEYKIAIRKYSRGNTTLYQVAYGNNKGHSGTWHDMINTGEKENLIDCCVSMIMVLRQFYESELNETISNYEQSERTCHR